MISRIAPCVAFLLKNVLVSSPKIQLSFTWQNKWNFESNFPIFDTRFEFWLLRLLTGTFVVFFSSSSPWSPGTKLIAQAEGSVFAQLLRALLVSTYFQNKPKVLFWRWQSRPRPTLAPPRIQITKQRKDTKSEHYRISKKCILDFNIISKSDRR